MSKEEAMKLYVQQLAELFEVMPLDEKARELAHVLGPFYEMVFEKSFIPIEKAEEKISTNLSVDNGADSESESEAFCDTSNTMQFEVLQKPIGNGSPNFADSELANMHKRLDSLHLSMEKAVDIISKLSTKFEAVQRLASDSSSGRPRGCYNSILFKFSNFLISKPSLLICIIFIWPLLSPFLFNRLAKLFYKRHRSIGS